MHTKKMRTIDTYQTSAEAMKKKFDDIGVRKEDVERAFGFIRAKNPRVVEIGCGYGREAKEIIRHTTAYVGIDISEVFIRMAQRDVPNAEFQVADIETYSFPKNVDIIFSFASLLHSDEEQVKKIFHRAHGALNPDGIFYISLKYGAYAEVTKKDEFGERTYYLYTPEQIKEIAGVGFVSMYEDTQIIRDQKWFTICLRKKE